MKWFNKLTKLFKAEEDEVKETRAEEDKPIDINSLKERNSQFSNRQESPFFLETETRKDSVIPGEIDAKISYQYPKGKFRFPVIPDYEPRERRVPRQSTQSNVRPTFSEANVKEVVVNRQPYITPDVQEEERKRRPFSPTQIPSPVYGFQKRPIKTEEEVPEKKMPVRERTVETTADIPAIFRKEDPFSTNPKSVESVRSVMNFPSAIEDFQDGEEKNVSDTPSINEVKQEQVLDCIHEEKKGNDSLAVDHQDIDHNRAEPLLEGRQDIEEDSVIEGISFNKEEAAVSLESIDNTEMLTLVEPTSSDFVSDEKSMIANLHEGTEPLEQTMVEENKDREKSLIEVPVQEEVAATVEVESVEEIESKSVTAPPKRKPVPFNVVMLRQDRLKMQNRAQEDEKKTAKIIESSGEVIQSERIEPIVDEEKVQIDELPYYHFPSIHLLSAPVVSESDDEWLDQQGFMLNETLLNFNVRAKVVNITQGPAVTQFEVQPEPGVKVNKITNLTDDIKLCLAAQDIRIEAPIPGKHTIGIEIPNRKSRAVPLREILESRAFIESESPLTVALGLDITGAPVVTDLRKMPHGLIAGATGSGKSVCINTMLISLLYKATPQDVKLLLIDPKVVELAPYNNIPHLVSPVITDVKAATAALKWAVEEMDRRYELFAHTGVRDLQRFNKKAEEVGEYAKKLPYIVIIIDELADLMMVSPAEVEESICRIAQKARACGIHLVLATQRPSVDVITGLIKANIPTRIAFSVSSQVDSRTIIDTNGADKLLGRGDMLFLENGSSKTVRLQGTFVSDEEIEEVVDFVKKEQEPQYLFVQEDLLAKAQLSDERDELFVEACEFVVYQNAASTSSLQRRFHIGYNRAARLMDMLESNGIISEARGSKPRDVLMTEAEIQEWLQAQKE